MRTEAENFLRYSADFFEKAKNTTLVHFSQMVELRRRSARDLHYLAGLAGETIISNEMFRVNDASGALASRIVVLPLTRGFYGKEDKELMEKILPELPGILLWAIEGRHRLHERGCFKQPESAGNLVTQMEDLSSPVGAFIRDRCEVAREFSIEMGELYLAWKEWATARGHHVSTEVRE